MPNPPQIVEQYQAVHSRGGLYHRRDRGVIEVTGKDRATWLNNLVTNEVKKLTAGEGNYAFATNVKGRTVFDLGILLLADRLWLDIDLSWIPVAMKHFNKYIITEDVTIADRSGEIDRFAAIGPSIHDFASRLGFNNVMAMSQWQHFVRHQDNTEPSGSRGPITLLQVRNDFAGLPTTEFFMLGEPRSALANDIEQLAKEFSFPILLRETVDILRIEAGIPASVEDIDEDVVPPETGRVEQGISYHKGCYLGQEVIERMRSHGILARRLVGLRLDDEEGVQRGSQVQVDEKDVGRITSFCWSEALAAPLAMGYVKSVMAQPGTKIIVVAGPRSIGGEVIGLPIRR